MFCQANTNPDLHLAKIEHMPQMIVFVTNSFLTKAREGANIECKKKIPPPPPPPPKESCRKSVMKFDMTQSITG